MQAKVSVMKRIRIFISSVQSEFAEERAMLSQYIRTDALLGKFFETFIFEDVPANEASPQQVYLNEVEMADIYLGLYGNKYGYEDEEGVSPTEREYDRAAELHKTRLVFIKSIDEEHRHSMAHRDYTSNGSVQVMLFRNRLEVWNPGQLPYGLTVNKLLEPHKSLPANPLIADPLFWTGYVDKVGTGTEDIVNLCKDKGLKSPEYHQEEDFRVVIWRRGGQTDNVSIKGPSKGLSKGLSRDQVCEHLNQEWNKIDPLIRGLEKASSAAELRALMGMNNATKFKKNYLDPLIELGIVRMTDPDSPNSPKQRYVLTDTAKGFLL